ncbi:MAG: membrane dipeptidase [Candidatus Brocadiia bacterium]|nr:MAG: membrane dipeptidase [Candidatus Brocadiia bacterium]
MNNSRLFYVLPAGLIIVLGLAGFAPTSVYHQDSIERLHKDALVWDCHNDLVYRVLYEKLDIGERLPAGQVDIPRLKEGGVDVQVVALFVKNSLYPNRCAKQAFQMIEAMKKAITDHSDSVELARTGSDVERIVKVGKIAMPLSIEGGHAIENNLELLRKYHALGVSSMTLTHAISHDWADSSTDKPRWHGLTDFGKEVVREMNRLHMVIDVSHVSDDTFYDVLKTTSQPVIASHSCCRAINPHPRNMTDEMIKALAENGGVIGINYVLYHLSEEYNKARNELIAIGKPLYDRLPEVKDLDLRIATEHLDAGRYWPLENLPTIEDILDHIDHAVNIAGVDHVGLGADMYPRMLSPVGMRGAQDYPAITRGLKKKGYSDEAVRKIMGGNMLRMWNTVTD